MRAIKFIKNGEEHYIGDVSKEYVDGIIEKTEEKNFFSMPTIGTNLIEIIRNAEARQLPVLVDDGGDGETTGRTDKWIVDNFVSSTSEPSHITATNGYTRKIFYYDGNGVCTKIKDVNYNAGPGINIGDHVDYSDMRGPCPEGFHVPTKDELEQIYEILVNTFGMSAAWETYKTYLKMPLTGSRNCGTANTQNQGTGGYYWSSTADSEYPYSITGRRLTPGEDVSCWGYSIRGFKDVAVAPDNTWTTLYDGPGTGGIFHNATLGLISISGDYGYNWITIADKNVGATVVYNDGDALDETNCGGYFQWGNNYMFPFTGDVTTTTTRVDVEGYGPRNYYSSSTFVRGGSWYYLRNDNLRGGKTGVVDNAITNTGVLSVNGETGRITIEGNKVKFFTIPQVGDDLTEIINAATGEYLPVLTDSWEDNESAITGTNRYIVEDCIIYSVASGSRLVATRGSSSTYFYFDSNNICTSIEEKSAHSELITTVTQDQNDGTMVVCSTGYGLSDGTVIHLTCAGFYDNILQKVSFNSGIYAYPLIYPSGNPDPRYGTLQKQFDMTAQVMGGDEAYFELTGMILNGKVYVWDFYKREYREDNE